MSSIIMLEEVRENDYVFLKRGVVKEFPELSLKMSSGGLVKRVDDKGVAEVEIKRVERIHISKLTIENPIV